MVSTLYVLYSEQAGTPFQHSDDLIKALNVWCLSHGVQASSHTHVYAHSLIHVHIHVLAAMSRCTPTHIHTHECRRASSMVLNPSTTPSCPTGPAVTALTVPMPSVSALWASRVSHRTAAYHRRTTVPITGSSTSTPN